MNEAAFKQRKLLQVQPAHPIQIGLAAGKTNLKVKRKWTTFNKKYVFRLIKYIIVIVVLYYLLNKINLS